MTFLNSEKPGIPALRFQEKEPISQLGEMYLKSCNLLSPLWHHRDAGGERVLFDMKPM